MNVMPKSVKTELPTLIIVESPAKATTIKGYLGANYKVIASKGHIRDLPKSTLGVDVENDFAPHYINIRGKSDVIAQLKKEAKSAGKVYLATDPDREGEAISWHLATALDIPLDETCRVTFNEITKPAIKEAVKNPRRIDMELVNSQQARRILDRIVGYQLSPFLWKNVKSGLSAGRVQSVATRMVCEREDEIRAFNPREYWTVEAALATEKGEGVHARYISSSDGKNKPECEAEANAIIDAVRDGRFRVAEVKTAQKSRQPFPPFTTSTMQQEASKKLGYQSQRIMKIAQELYEGVNLGSKLGGVQGLITYMRTDSLRVAESAQESALDYIKEQFGGEYCPEKPNIYKSKANAQDAHEAIRPSKVTLMPDAVKERLTPEQYKLYRLIWERFVASQMTPAIYDTVTVDAVCGTETFRVGGYTVRFRGYTVVYDNGDNEEMDAEEALDAGKLPAIKKGDILRMENIEKTQHFTEPPARYNDASLIKVLEESGIGRPSTYTTIITTIIAREYVKRSGKSLLPTPLGEVITNLMKDSFPEIVDYEFTAQLENKLDSIEHGETTTSALLTSFYGDFERTLNQAMETAKNGTVELPVEQSDIDCEKCGTKMIYKTGRFGKFLACPNYPTCRNTIALDKEGNPVSKADTKELRKADFKCELCGSDMVIRAGRYGDFYACSNYPTCRFTKPIIHSTGVACPKCSADIVVRHSRGGKVFYSCEKYPDCDFSTWDMPLSEKCPECSSMLTYKKGRKMIVCTNLECKYERQQEVKVIE